MGTALPDAAYGFRQAAKEGQGPPPLRREGGSPRRSRRARATSQWQPRIRAAEPRPSGGRAPRRGGRPGSELVAEGAVEQLRVAPPGPSVLVVGDEKPVPVLRPPVDATAGHTVLALPATPARARPSAERDIEVRGRPPVAGLSPDDTLDLPITAAPRLARRDRPCVPPAQTGGDVSTAAASLRGSASGPRRPRSAREPSQALENGVQQAPLVTPSTSARPLQARQAS
jgi:hypothetical protein